MTSPYLKNALDTLEETEEVHFSKCSVMLTDGAYILGEVATPRDNIILVKAPVFIIPDQENNPMYNAMNSFSDDHIQRISSHQVLSISVMNNHGLEFYQNALEDIQRYKRYESLHRRAESEQQTESFIKDGMFIHEEPEGTQ